nr:MAG TPA: hypothetical protein [Caudoviricetes sp.]
MDFLLFLCSMVGIAQKFLMIFLFSDFVEFLR